jgi:inositol phosphorylceramide mannosyltransferase catalytic subunit
MIIPKILHQIWLGGELPRACEIFRDRWKRNHPKWEFPLWNEDNLPELQNQELFDNAKSYAEASDVARYEILQRYGGVYADCDYSAKRNIEPVIKDARFFITCDLKHWNTRGGLSAPYLNNALMGCIPNHPVITMLVDKLPEWVEQNCDEYVVMRTGPGYVSIMLLGEPEVFIPPLDAFRGVYARHHYFNSWKGTEPKSDHFHITVDQFVRKRRRIRP